MTVTAEVLREKLPEKGSQYTRILKGVGKVSFLRKGEQVVGCYDAEGELLHQGAEEEVAMYLDQRANPLPPPDVPAQEAVPEASPVAVEEAPPEVEEPKPKKKERPVTGVSTVPEKRGKGTGRGSAYRAYVFGRPVTAIIRWCWQDGFTFDQIKIVMNHYLPEAPPRDTTLKLQRNALRRGDKTAPELTIGEVSELRAFKK